MAKDLSKQQALCVNREAIQQINFTRSLRQSGNTTMLFIIKKAKETLLNFLQ